jgi:hypothetical protein
MQDFAFAGTLIDVIAAPQRIYRECFPRLGVLSDQDDQSEQC